MKISWPTNGSVMILKPSAVKRLIVVRMAEDDLFHVVRVVAFDRRNIERAGQILDHRIQQRLHTLVLERRCRTAPGRASSRWSPRAAPCAARPPSASRLRETCAASRRRSRQPTRPAACGRLPPSSSRFAGISSTSYLAPMVSSCHRMARISIRSITPLKAASWPMGI